MREVSLELRVLGLDQRLAALEQQIVTLIAAITRARSGPPETQPWDGLPPKLVGIDEAGAVIAEDREMLKRMAEREITEGVEREYESRPVQNET